MERAGQSGGGQRGRTTENCSSTPVPVSSSSSFALFYFLSRVSSLRNRTIID